MKLWATILFAFLMLGMAGSAHAASVEVFHEGPGVEPCDPCDIHLVGETSIIALPSGLELSKCQDELEGTINQNGTGELTWTGTPHDPVGPGCIVVNCINGEDHWPLSFPVEDAGEVRVTLRICYRVATGAELHCDVVVTIPETPTHDQQLTASQLCASNLRRVDGNWQTESSTHDSLELVHGEGTSIEMFREEPHSEPCDPCEIHLVGESSIIALPSNIEVVKCHDELEGTINQDGTGELAWTGTTHATPGPGCIAFNCTAPGEDHWPLSFPVEDEGEVRVTLRVCYRGPVNEAHCDLVITIPETPTHDQQFITDQLCLSNTRRVQANWQTESTTHDSLEFIHADP